MVEQAEREAAVVQKQRSYGGEECSSDILEVAPFSDSFDDAESVFRRRRKYATLSATQTVRFGDAESAGQCVSATPKVCFCDGDSAKPTSPNTCFSCAFVQFAVFCYARRDEGNLSVFLCRHEMILSQRAATLLDRLGEIASSASILLIDPPIFCHYGCFVDRFLIAAFGQSRSKQTER